MGPMGRGTAGRDDVTARARHLLALGSADGAVRVLDPATGADVVPPGSLAAHHAHSQGTGIGGLIGGGGGRRGGGAGGGEGGGGDPGRRVVAVSFDSSATFLAAINANGDASVFELSYRAGGGTGGEGGAAPRPHPLPNAVGGRGGGGRFPGRPPVRPDPRREGGNGMGNGGQPTPGGARHPHGAAGARPGPRALRLPPARRTRSRPCLAIDPAYRRRREKSVLVGFTRREALS